jgi:hypothetical protein
MTDLSDRQGKPTQPQWAKPLTAREAQRELGPLQTVADAERWLERIPLMARVGRLRSRDTTAALVNALRAWCRRHSHDLSVDAASSIQRQLAAIELAAFGRRRMGATSGTTQAASRPAVKPGFREQRRKQRRRLADRRWGRECRSSDDRRQVRRRQRNSSGRRSGQERRNNLDRRSPVERRTLRDRRGLAGNR